jgi:hypothetical protein
MTAFDCAVRNSAPLFFFGYSNFPARRELICKNYLAPYLQGEKIKDKMDTFYRLTINKMFIFVNHRERKAWHIDTHTGVCTELKELGTQAEHAGVTAEAGGEPSAANHSAHPYVSFPPPSPPPPPPQNRKRKRGRHVVVVKKRT